MLREFICHHCGAIIFRRVGKGVPDSEFRFCNNSCKGEWQRTKKPVSREWLVEHYIEKRLDCTQIASMVHRDPKSVWNWMRDLKIKTRPRGANGGASARKWVKGNPSAFKGQKHSEKTKKLLREISIADGRVPFDPKIGSYMKGRKGDNTPGWKGGLTPERQAFYSTTEWAECVKEVWKRDDAKCRRCGIDFRSILRGTISFHIHHIDSFMIRERRAVVQNLLLVCQHCHNWIHGKKNKQGDFLGQGH